MFNGKHHMTVNKWLTSRRFATHSLRDSPYSNGNSFFRPRCCPVLQVAPAQNLRRVLLVRLACLSGPGECRLRRNVSVPRTAASRTQYPCTSHARSQARVSVRSFKRKSNLFLHFATSSRFPVRTADSFSDLPLPQPVALCL